MQFALVYVLFSPSFAQVLEAFYADMFYMVFLISSRQIPGCNLKLSHYHIHSNLLFTDHYITGYIVAQLVEALRYKSEGRGLDSQWGL
jgi:hypothetical protein